MEENSGAAGGVVICLFCSSNKNSVPEISRRRNTTTQSSSSSSLQTLLDYLNIDICKLGLESTSTSTHYLHTKAGEEGGRGRDVLLEVIASSLCEQCSSLSNMIGRVYGDFKMLRLLLVGCAQRLSAKVKEGLEGVVVSSNSNASGGTEVGELKVQILKQCNLKIGDVPKQLLECSMGAINDYFDSGSRFSSSANKIEIIELDDSEEEDMEEKEGVTMQLLSLEEDDGRPSASTTENAGGIRPAIPQQIDITEENESSSASASNGEVDDGMAMACSPDEPPRPRNPPPDATSSNDQEIRQILETNHTLILRLGQVFAEHRKRIRASEGVIMRGTPVPEERDSRISGLEATPAAASSSPSSSHVSLLDCGVSFPDDLEEIVSPLRLATENVVISSTPQKEKTVKTTTKTAKSRRQPSRGCKSSVRTQKRISVTAIRCSGLKSQTRTTRQQYYPSKVISQTEWKCQSCRKVYSTRKALEDHYNSDLHKNSTFAKIRRNLGHSRSVPFNNDSRLKKECLYCGVVASTPYRCHSHMLTLHPHKYLAKLIRRECSEEQVEDAIVNVIGEGEENAKVRPVVTRRHYYHCELCCSVVRASSKRFHVLDKHCSRVITTLLKSSS